ncbi:hypothetical protein [Salirhabdus salicampi]|nr:hypothetical protein [Salirhabdus salicampi]MCP8615687.1 hypothetical protein [Salirhabdus salicampi]
MEQEQYEPATLPHTLLEKLKSFEQELRQQTNEEIILIAYEEHDKK